MTTIIDFQAERAKRHARLAISIEGAALHGPYPAAAYLREAIRLVPLLMPSLTLARHAAREQRARADSVRELFPLIFGDY